jgi:rhodanese-related sulfurtransferase
MDRRHLLLAGGAAAAMAYWFGWLPAMGASPPNLTRRPLTAAELAGDPGTLIVDIRTPGEWQETGVIAGALLVTYEDADSFLRAVAPHLRPGQTLALICRSDNRTGHASRAIAPRISHAVVDVQGGMLRLRAAGQRMVPPGPVAERAADRAGRATGTDRTAHPCRASPSGRSA